MLALLFLTLLTGNTLTASSRHETRPELSKLQLLNTRLLAKVATSRSRLHNQTAQHGIEQLAKYPVHILSTLIIIGLVQQPSLGLMKSVAVCGCQ